MPEQDRFLEIVRASELDHDRELEHFLGLYERLDTIAHSKFVSNHDPRETIMLIAPNASHASVSFQKSPENLVIIGRFDRADFAGQYESVACYIDGYEGGGTYTKGIMDLLTRHKPQEQKVDLAESFALMSGMIEDAISNLQTDEAHITVEPGYQDS